jgi:hypothetical protein
MKEFNDILQQFDGLTDLPVSEEFVGAYLEGNLDSAHMSETDKVLHSDANASHLLSSMKEIDSAVNQQQLDNDDSPAEESYMDLESEDPNFVPLLDSNISLIQKKMHEHENFGYEPNHSESTFDPNIYQGNQPSCAVRSQEIIMRDYGISIPQEELIQFATERGWYSSDPVNGGTPRDATGNLLDAMGIKTKRYDNASIFDIINELKAGHRVIVSVDADELWIKKEPNLYKRIFGEITNRINDKLDDINGREGANHALIVAGINVDPSNPSDMKVVLIDSGTGDVCIEYNFFDFKKAWDDSHCHMITTTQAAPFQYNYVTHQMEPSNFKSDYMPSLVSLPAGLHNQFKLPNTYIEEYGNVTPEYSWDHVIPFWESWKYQGDADTVQMLAHSSNPSNEKSQTSDNTKSLEDDDDSTRDDGDSQEEDDDFGSTTEEDTATSTSGSDDSDSNYSDSGEDENEQENTDLSSESNEGSDY